MANSTPPWWVGRTRDSLIEELSELRDYAKCYVENNEALQKENAELMERVVDLEQEVESLRHELGI